MDPAPGSGSPPEVDAAALAAARADARRQVGRFLLLAELGRGGMGAVYRAWDDQLGREVALKLVLDGGGDAEALARFAREAEALARVRHPNVLAVYEAGEAGGRPYLVTPLLAGGPLEALLRGDGLVRVSLRRRVELVRDAARGVAAAHAQGVLHRDLKPHNVLLDAEGRAQVADFGLARLVGDRARLTATGELLGTPAYAAPEQLGEGRADARSDVYGLAGLLYFALTGAPPFAGPTPVNVISAVLRQPPAPPSTRAPDVPAALEALCLAGLAKDPAARPASAEAFALALDAWLAGAAAPPSARAAPGRRRAGVGLALAAAAAGALALGVRAWRASAPVQVTLRADARARVQLAGRPPGRVAPEAPLVVTLAPGRHALRLERAGVVVEQTLEVPAGAPLDVALVLTREVTLDVCATAEGTLTLEDPEGDLPPPAWRALALPATLRLPAGRYRLAARAPGHRPRSQDLRVTPHVPPPAVAPLTPFVREVRRRGPGSVPGARPLALDVDGDGCDDLLLLEEGERGTRLVAWSGRDGGALWSHPRVATYCRPVLVETRPPALVVAERLERGPGARLSWLDPATGAELRSFPVDADPRLRAHAVVPLAEPPGAVALVFEGDEGGRAPRHEVVALSAGGESLWRATPPEDTTGPLALTPRPFDLDGAGRADALLWGIGRTLVAVAGPRDAEGRRHARRVDARRHEAKDGLRLLPTPPGGPALALTRTPLDDWELARLDPGGARRWLVPLDSGAHDTTHAWVDLPGAGEHVVLTLVRTGDGLHPVLLVDAATGAVRARMETSHVRSVACPLRAADGRVAFAIHTEAGEVLLLDERLRERWRAPFPGRSGYCLPCPADVDGDGDDELVLAWTKAPSEVVVLDLDLSKD